MNRGSWSARLAAALVAPTFFSGRCARGKACLWSFLIRPGTQANGSAADVVYEALTTCRAPPPPPIGPPEVNFSPYLSIQLLLFGDYFRGGEHSLSSGWKLRALTPLSPWGGLCARHSSGTSSPRVIGRGELHFGGTARRFSAAFARRWAGAANSHATAAGAPPISGGADLTSPDDHADAAPARYRACAARTIHRIERDSFPRLCWAQARRLCVARRHGGVGDHELPGRRAGGDRI